MLKKLLKSVAPALGAAIGGPFGGMAGKFIADKLGEAPPKNDTDLLKIVQKALGDPEQALKLKQAENDFVIQLERIGVDVFQIEAADRQDARQFAAKTSMLPQLVLSALFIGGYFAILIYRGTDPSFTVDAMTFGVITAAVPMIMQFWFGSSHGSKTKSDKSSSSL